MSGTLPEKLMSRLLARYAGRGVHTWRCDGGGTQAVATFSARHPDVSDLEIHADQGDVTITVGRLTHGHFSPSNDHVPPDVRHEEVIGRVLAFLDAVFADQVEFWLSLQIGGWHARGTRPLRLRVVRSIGQAANSCRAPKYWPFARVSNAVVGMIK